MILKSERPRLLAAKTYSRSRKERHIPRMMRANPAQPTKERMMMIAKYTWSELKLSGTAARKANNR